MCGITGIYAFHDAAKPIDRAELHAMREQMLARGPDGAGQWFGADGRIGLAHRRLAILDLSERGAQPMASADGRYVISFNGEIYNHPELKRALERDGVLYRSGTDTETLLHLYARDGAAMVQRVQGMFALAIWDVLERKLFLARDPYGIKPLYYANDGWTFRFASQVKALRAGGAVGADPEPAGVVGFEIFGHVPEPFTLYREIRALRAGHTLTVDWLGAAAPQPFFDFAQLHARQAQAPSLSPDQRAGRIRSAVAASVERHLLSDVDVGVFLSAGVDSGAILGLAARAAAHPPRALTLGFAEFRGREDDEAPLAAEVARHYGAAHQVRLVGEAEFKRDQAAILAAMDQPSIDGVNTWFIAKAAKEQGLKVALSGLGGDELFAGYPSFADLPRWRRLRHLARVPGAGRSAALALHTVAPGWCRRHPKAPFLLDYSRSWASLYLAKRALFLPEELRHRMDPAFLRAGLERLDPVASIARSLAPDPGSDIARISVLESCHYMRNQLLRDADWAGMAHGVEIRTPLVDSQLLTEIAPLMRDLAPGEGKRALAQAPQPALPERVVRRPKTGFTVPTAAWMARASQDPLAAGNEPSRGSASRRWAAHVIAAFAP